MAVIETRALRKCYGEDECRVEALRGIDLRVPWGEFLAIMGPSGSGKSTLLHSLGGVDTPTSGQVLLENVDMAKLSDDERTILRRQRIGFIFQSFNLLATLTAEENVGLPLLLDGIPQSQVTARSHEMLKNVGMYHRRNHLPSKMSGGEQQRVAIARALVIRPVLLLADEPTGNLDSANGEQITALLRSLVDDHHHTIVMVTHDQGVAMQADRLVRVRDGMIESDEALNGYAERRTPVEEHA
jgi:putative ABC transport system ATP-binding protein